MDSSPKNQYHFNRKDIVSRYINQKLLKSNILPDKENAPKQPSHKILEKRVSEGNLMPLSSWVRKSQQSISTSQEPIQKHHIRHCFISIVQEQKKLDKQKCQSKSSINKLYEYILDRYK